MSRAPRGADALVRTLQRAGTRVVFSLSGNHIMPVYDALLGSGIRLIHTRHEAAAVHMADAWARLTGEVGVALVTGGPGHANAVSALYTAQMAESPVLLLSGHAPHAQLGMGAFQEMRQADMAAPVTQASWTCAGPAAVAADLARAMQLARSGRHGPVHLSLPSDALESPASLDDLPRDEAFAPVPMPLGDRDALAMLGLLRQARRPLILAGPGSLTRGGRLAAAALESACGVPVIGMESPRGVADPSAGALADVLAESDLVLLVGKRLDFTLKFGQAPAFRPDARWLQVDAEPAEVERTRRAVGTRLLASTQADAASAVDSLTRVAKALPIDSEHGAWCGAVRDALSFRPAAWAQARASEPGRLHPVQALAPLQAVLDSHPDAVFISDGGEIGQWAQACLRAPHRVINGVAGSIGSALPFALAARCALPTAPIVAVMGDGTFGFHLAEMDTALRYGLPLVAVVGNDARWNAEHQIQLKDYGAERLIGCELRPTRYDLVTAAFGGHGECVTEPAGLLPAVQRALDSGLPACVNVMIEGVPAPQVRRALAP
ncbi:thiamine pyrophosphate-binding protein [Ideonella sp. A 288]|uniref:thiamine pyrophosphate-binding protein n=1 Tax=Ideonella sp. A 288 TaxID=1962181 RepID=UPI0018FE0A30|nr:thiamine pyrophosphate-binding protein [Ideonella sp. A 288]